MEPRRQPENNVGLVRIMLALLVVLSHSSELVDGNRSREILTRLFGTLSFGEVGVDGFFLLSGYLVTRSLQLSASASSYLVKRILRIYPGYVLAFLVTMILVAPLAGATSFFHTSFRQQIMDMLFLNEPVLQGAFTDLHYPRLNASMWTIAYEFRCYLLILLAGLLGILERRLLFLAMVAALIILRCINPVFADHWIWTITGHPALMLRFAILFGCGALFYLFADRIVYSRAGLAAAAAILAGAMFLPRFAELGLATAGAYLLFWFAFHAPATGYDRFGRKFDLSYGIYLYAWPIQSLLVHWHHAISPWTVLLVTVPASALAAMLSWCMVERPCMQLRTSLIGVADRPGQLPL